MEQWKDCSPLLIIREVWNKLQWDSTSYTLAGALLKKNNKCWRKCGAIGTLAHCWWECKNGSYWKRVVPERLKMGLSHDPAIALLAICRKELKAGCRRDWFTAFAAALFSVAKMWKQLIRPLTDEWISIMWYMHKMEYCSALKKKKILHNTLQHGWALRASWENYSFHLSEVLRIVKTIMSGSKMEVTRG